MLKEVTLRTATRFGLGALETLNLCMNVYNKSGSKTKKHFRACT